MPKLSVKDIPTLPAIAEQLLAEEADAACIALHEAAHFVAAVSMRAVIDEVWVKARRGSGVTISTAGADGLTGVFTSDPHKDCFVSLVGAAWDVRALGAAEANITAHHDMQKHNFKRPWVFDDAQSFIEEELNLIHHTAAGILGLRTAQGWLKGGRLNHLTTWVRLRAKRRKSHYEKGEIPTDEPW